MDEKIIVCTWGYSMRLVDFAKIIGRTPKKVRCVMIGNEEVHDGFLRGTSYPIPEKITSEPFLLTVKTDNNGVEYYKGSFPYAGDNNKRLDVFVEYKGKGESFDHCD
jgi:hypothetical protein